MARKSKTGEQEVMREQPSEAFVEREGEELPQRSQRITLRVNSEGTVDWDSMSDKQKARFAEVVSQDPDALEMIGLAAGGDTPENPLAVTPEHVGYFLDIFAMAESWVIPPIIEKQSKGLIKITREEAAQVYTFTEDQKKALGPPGAQWANENFPEWLRKFLLEIGPGAQFFGQLGLIAYGQTQQLVNGWKEAHKLPGGGYDVSVQPINGKEITKP